MTAPTGLPAFRLRGLRGLRGLHGLLGWRPRLLAGAGLLALGALLVPAEGLAGAALRAGGLLGALAAVAGALRADAGTPRLLSVVGREPLGRGGGLALVEVEGRRLLLGYSPAGTTLLLDLTREARP